MEINRQYFRLILSLAALSLSLAACHGASPGSTGYVPPGSAMSLPQQNVGIAPNGEERGEVVSSCGTRIRIVLAGILNCHFREGGDHDVRWKLQDHTQGLILLSPTSGGRFTKVTITGLVIGSGYFVVRADDGKKLTVNVKVTL